MLSRHVLAKGALVQLTLLACSSCQSSNVAIKSIALPSGKSVHITAAAKVNFANGEPAFVVKYQTDLAVSDADALRREVDEVWAVFRPEIESANLNSAIITANEIPKGWFLPTPRVYNFVFHKSVDGGWISRDPDTSRQ